MRQESNNETAILLKEVAAFPPLIPAILKHSRLESLVGVLSYLLSKQHAKECILRTVESQLCHGKEKAEWTEKVFR